MIQNQLRTEEYTNFDMVVNPQYLSKKTKLTQFDGVQKLVMLDRYSLRDNNLKTLKAGDVVVTTVKEDPKYPTQGFGTVKEVRGNKVVIDIEFPESVTADDGSLVDLENFVSPVAKVIKPLELYWEQICYRAAKGVSSVEKSRGLRRYWFKKFFWMLKNQYAIPGGRILYGAGSNNNVTLFNCFSGDTIVQTKEGAKSIKSLSGEVEVLSQGGVYRKADFRSFGEQELFEIELDNGELIKTTAGHEWVVKKHGGYERVTTLDLEGRKIPMVSNKPIRDLQNPTIKEGIKHGLFYGDGSVSNNYGQLLLFGEKENLAEWFEDDFGTHNIVPHYNGDYLRVGNINPDLKKLPSEDASSDYWYGFILGLIATDGCVDSRGSVMFHSSNLEDLKVICRNLYKTGFLYSSLKMTRKTSPYTGEYAPTYKVQLIKNSVCAGDLLKKSHQDNFIFSGNFTKTQTITVNRVTALGVSEEVYCCVEPETHTFVVGTGYLTGNCFVLDYIEDSRKGISKHRETTMEIMSRGGGVGSNGSALRPKDAFVQGVNGKSSGSVSWLNDLSNLTQLVQQGGSRRGAQMIGLADWHPDLISFILCKIQNPHVLNKIYIESDNEVVKQVVDSILIRDEEGKPSGVRDMEFMTGANISVLTSDDFMTAVQNDEEWVFRFPDLENLTPDEKAIYDEEWQAMGDVRKWEERGLPVKVYHTIKATDLWNIINIASRYSAEPGIIYIDTCNKESNSWYYAPLVVTNPCGEQPLPKNAVCNLIAINLAEMYDKLKRQINYPVLRKVTHISQRFADNIIDHSYYFLDENEKMAKNERRIGKGVMGLGDLMIDLKLPYGSEEMLETTDKLFNFIKEESYLASTNLAEEKGSFAYYDEDKYLQSGFMSRMSDRVVEQIKQKGIRNVCSLTVAPTGSTGTMVGVSTGLEPYFSFKYFRSGRLGKFIEVNTPISQRYFDENPEATELPSYFVGSSDISAVQHAKVQAVIQKHIDSAISKTCNAPSNFTVEDNKELYMLAWESKCKGVTVYVDGSRDSQVLSHSAEDNSFDSVEGDTEEAQEVKELEPVGVSTASEVSNVTVSSESDLLSSADTRTCDISFDASGNMIKECH